MKISSLIIALATCVCWIAPSVGASADDMVTVALENYEPVAQPCRAKEAMQEDLLVAQLDLCDAIRRCQGGIGTYYECFTAAGNILLLKLEIDRAERPEPIWTPEQKRLAQMIDANFQQRIALLANFLHTGYTTEMDIFRLRINALRFKRNALAHTGMPASDLLAERENISRDIQTFLTKRLRDMEIPADKRLEEAFQLLTEKKPEPLRRKDGK